MICFALTLFAFAVYGAIRAAVSLYGAAANRAERARRRRVERGEGETAAQTLRPLSSLVRAGIDVPPHVEHLPEVTSEERRIDVDYLNAMYALNTHERDYR